MNTYEFRRYATYEEWFTVEAKTEQEAWDKFNELGEPDRDSAKLIGLDGAPELYRTKINED